MEFSKGKIALKLTFHASCIRHFNVKPLYELFAKQKKIQALLRNKMDF